MHLLLFDLVNIGCWGGCFWWMHRISTRQDAMLEQLQKQAHRIEGVAKEEHKILAELHPNVEAIKEHVSAVSEKVAEVKGAVDDRSGS